MVFFSGWPVVDKQGFILTRQWRDTRQGIELEFWLATNEGAFQIRVPHQQAVFFIPEELFEQAQQLLSRFNGWSCKSVALRDFSMRHVIGFYFDQQRTLRAARDYLFEQGLNPLESDINPYDRFLMERFVLGSLRFRGEPQQANNVKCITSPDVTSCEYKPDLKIISLDIETAIDELALYSIAVYGVNTTYTALSYQDEKTMAFSKVFMVANEFVDDSVDVFANERLLLIDFFDWINNYDPDIIIGWNVVNFDFWYLERVCQKHKMAFQIARAGGIPHWRKLDDEGNRKAVSIAGRVILDGIELLKTAAYQFESFSLNTVAGQLLGDGKLIAGNDRGEKITQLFNENKQALAQYNIQDCKLVWDIFDHAGLLDFAIARSQLTGLPLDRIGGSVASFDFRYLPLLHREGFVAPNGHLSQTFENSPGGFVMDSQPGIYDNVLVLDFKSLYPSIIRTFKVDPMGMAIGLQQDLDQCDMVPGFKGAWFAKDKNLLPKIIENLWCSRDVAKKNNDQALSHAIKIIMNSFYGVLGSGGCRFFDSRLASSITKRGHQIIQQTAVFIEKQGWPVIYGDTDSVFVWLRNISDEHAAKETGSRLARLLNLWWKKRLLKEYGVDSALELEFETHFKRFLMPTIRGSEQGSKKRYAGMVDDGENSKLVFKGLETVRTDWTRLARDFQRELYRRVFFEEPFLGYIKTTVQQVRNGERDNDLIYRKRLRRKLEDYQKNIPPHIQAARKAVNQHNVKVFRGDWIEYVMTHNGAESITAHHSLIDYQYYIDRQLAPVADGILHFLGHNFESIIAQQMGLFTELE